MPLIEATVAGVALAVVEFLKVAPQLGDTLAAWFHSNPQATPQDVLNKIAEYRAYAVKSDAEAEDAIAFFEAGKVPVVADPPNAISGNE